MSAIQSSPSIRARTQTVPVAIYTRVSTANQVGGRFDSCESQAAVCRDHIAKHAGDGWVEVACFSDPAYSASIDLKPSSSTDIKHTVLPVDFLPDSTRKIFFGSGGFSSLVD